jgi:selenocysteine lyase/cysteine desulfurase
MSSRRDFLHAVGGGLAAASAPARIPPAPANEAAFWADVRRRFDLEPGHAFLNTGTLGPCPRSVRERVTETLRQLDALPTTAYWAQGMPRFLASLPRLAGLLGASDPRSVTVTHSTTEGINIVARGLAWKPGDEVLTTTHEHVGGDAVFKHLARTRGVRLVRYAMPMSPPSDDEIVEGLARLVTARTRLIMVSHVLYTNALVMPVERIGALAERVGALYLVDGAHPLGQMRVDVAAMRAAFYAGSGHKWLCGPRGTGLLYVRPDLLDSLEPFTVSYDLADPPGDARAFHAGATRLNFVWTNNLHDVLGLLAAVEFHLGLGPERVRARCMALWRRLREGVRDVPGLEAVAVPEERSAPMLTLKVQGRANTEVFRALKGRGITVKEVADHELPEPINSIRAATHVFNSEEDVDRLVAGLREVLG